MGHNRFIGWEERQANKNPALDSDSLIGYTVLSQSLINWAVGPNLEKEMKNVLEFQAYYEGKG